MKDQQLVRGCQGSLSVNLQFSARKLALEQMRAKLLQDIKKFTTAAAQHIPQAAITTLSLPPSITSPGSDWDATDADENPEVGPTLSNQSPMGSPINEPPSKPLTVSDPPRPVLPE